MLPTRETPLVGKQQYVLGYKAIVTEIELEDNDQDRAEKKVDAMCKKLLANLIIEDYKVSKVK